MLKFNLVKVASEPPAGEIVDRTDGKVSKPAPESGSGKQNAPYTGGEED